MRYDNARNLYVNDKNGVVFPKDEVDRAYTSSFYSGLALRMQPVTCGYINGYIQLCFHNDHRYTLHLLLYLTSVHGDVVTKRLDHHYADIVKYLLNPSFDTTKSLRILLTMGINFSDYLFADALQFGCSYLSHEIYTRRLKKCKEIITTLYFLGIQIHPVISRLELFHHLYTECVRDITLFDMLYTRITFTMI